MTTEPEHAIDVERLTKRYGRLLAVNDIGQGPETGVCGDRGRPSVLFAWP